MNSKLKMLLIFTGGLLFGAFTTFIITGKINQNLFANFYTIGVFEQLNTAQKLRENKQKELSENIENRLPGYVLAIHQNEILQDSDDSKEVLWHIKSFYERNSIPVPAEISEILNNLPPEPPNSCRFNNAVK